MWADVWAAWQDHPLRLGLQENLSKTQIYRFPYSKRTREQKVLWWHCASFTTLGSKPNLRLGASFLLRTVVPTFSSHILQILSSCRVTWLLLVSFVDIDWKAKLQTIGACQEACVCKFLGTLNRSNPWPFGPIDILMFLPTRISWDTNGQSRESWRLSKWQSSFADQNWLDSAALLPESKQRQLTR